MSVLWSLVESARPSWEPGLARMPDGGLHILYSALNLFLATVFCTWAVGSFAYKAIATSKSFRLRLWYWLWSGLTLLMLVPCLASFSNFNGWMRVLTLARWSLRPGDTTSWASRHHAPGSGRGRPLSLDSATFSGCDM